MVSTLASRSAWVDFLKQNFLSIHLSLCLSLSRSLGGLQACVCQRSHGVCVSWVSATCTHWEDTTHTNTHGPSRGYRLRSRGERSTAGTREEKIIPLGLTHTPTGTHTGSHTNTQMHTKHNKPWTLNSVAKFMLCVSQSARGLAGKFHTFAFSWNWLNVHKIVGYLHLILYIIFHSTVLL